MLDFFYLSALLMEWLIDVPMTPMGNPVIELAEEFDKMPTGP
jgi:hypothetical protein